MCPSMFRDLADYVFKWPFSHFKERVSLAAQDVAARCLSPVPVVYVHAGQEAGVLAWSRQVLRRPYILVSGQSDWPTSRSKQILADPFLVKWFAQNGDLSHPKVSGGGGVVNI